ncbi:MAG: conjugal transfer protein TraF [Nitrospira sp.]|uniref:conjugal transfer protein TraF n=1 Tax=Nitrospira cf. moscoviensis SBR1015 TaxID=96242 RepID=UPI000A3B7072|nr:conjugal transfer protein TraF [Nitrospira cf. moscoviensis SBR1015]MBH0208214.1 conjugal transfer protein TraF [Nitrospira sp.]
MHRSSPLRISLLLALSVWPSLVSAAEFVISGPRAMGMGGAGVAVTTNALATYWNPAGLAMTQTVDIRLQGGGQATDRLGIGDALHDLENFDRNDTAPANLVKAQLIADRINRPGATVSVNGSAGLYFKGHLGEHAFGFNVSDVATGGGFVSTPVTVTPPAGPGLPVTVTGQMALRGLEARQLAFSYAYAFADKTFSIGITAKVIQGAAYNGSTELQGGSGVSTTDHFGKPNISTTYGIDIGAIYRPSSWVRFGVVAKDINKPTFDAAGGGELKLEPQVRVGVAINPYSTLTLTADVDATSNKTFIPGVKSQLVSLGLEQTILSEFLSFRIGTFKNMQDASTPFVPTAGLGMRWFNFRADAGGGYDFREKGALVSASISLTF